MEALTLNYSLKIKFQDGAHIVPQTYVLYNRIFKALFYPIL